MPSPLPPPKRIYPSQLGPNIRKARSKAGLSQLALAHKLGYQGDDAGAFICRIELGQQQPRLDTLTRISKALKVSVGELL